VEVEPISRIEVEEIIGKVLKGKGGGVEIIMVFFQVKVLFA
jgi:hypothetical protein